MYEWIAEKYSVCIYSERLHLEQVRSLHPDIIISYNYKYIIDQAIIDYMKGNIINLHISLLPWNRGANPNFWSFIDNTPKGVTIHQINAGIDKGNIICQKECFFDIKRETFASTYDKLNQEIEALFKEKCEEIIKGEIVFSEQTGKGSYHTVKDFQRIRSKIEFQWSDNIEEFLARYERI